MKTKILEMESMPTASLASGSIVVFENLQASDVVKLAVSHQVLHIVQRQSRSFAHEISISELMLSHPKKYISDPLSLILPDTNGLQSFQLSCPAEEHKKAPLLQLEMFVKSVAGTKTIIGEVMAAAEELFTNASKNTGKFYKKLTNVTEVARTGSISLQARATKDTIVVGCVDSFGQLNIEQLMKKLMGCFEKGVANSIQSGSAGAGIGTFLIFNSATNLYIAVDKNKRTSVFFAFPLGMRTKHIQLLPKNLHLLTIEK